MPEGGTLTIATADRTPTAAELAEQAEAEPDDYVEIAMTGMPPEVMARVFEPLFTTKPIGKGPGWGCRNCMASCATPAASSG